MEKIHQRALKVVYGCEEAYKQFFLIANEVSVHQRDICALVMEILSSLNNVNSEFFDLILHSNSWLFINSKNGLILKLPRVTSGRIGTISLLLLCNRLPLFVKNFDSSIELKIKLKQLENIDFSGLICRDSIYNR